MFTSPNSYIIVTSRISLKCIQFMVKITMGWKCFAVSSIFNEHQFFNTVVIDNVILKVNCKTKEEDCKRFFLVSLLVKI